MKLTIKVTTPKTLIDIFNLGTAEDREAIADDICQAIYNSLLEEVYDGKD